MVFTCRSSIRWLVVGGMVVATAFFFTLMSACTTQAETPKAPKGTKEIRLGYFANVAHAQAMIGGQTGELAAAVSPARLTHRIFNGGPTLVEALFAGELDIGFIGPGPVINAFARSNGEGIRVIAAGASNGVVIVARENSGIESMADLKGRRIATPQLGNTQDISARRYLLRELRDVNDNQVISIPNAEQTGLMMRGEIDAAWVPEPWGARLVKEAGGRIIAEEKDLWPGGEFTLTVVVTTPEFLERHEEVVRRFLVAHQAITRRLNSDPEVCAALLNEAMKAESGKTLSVDVLRTAMSRTKYTTQVLEGTFRTYSKWMREVGFGKREVDLRGLIDTKILQSMNEK